MTILQQESFEAGGAVGTQVQLADVIFSSSSGASSILYATGLAGTKACNVAPATTGHLVNDGFTATKMGMRYLFRVTNFPAADTLISHANDGPTSTGTRMAELWLMANGQLRIRNQYANPVLTTAISTNTTYAVEWLLDRANSTQTLRLYNTTSLVATPIQTITTTLTNGTNITRLQVGKMTTGTWTGGLTFDDYMRMDDWVAAPTGASQTWDESFDGTVGNNVATNSNISLVQGVAPTFATGGPHIDQKVAYFQATSGATRYLRSNQLPAPPSPSYERFYVAFVAAPTAGYPIQFWVASNAAGDDLFSLGATRQTDNTFSIGLWDETWGTTVTVNDDITGLPIQIPAPPMSLGNDIPVGSWMRIDISTDDTNGPTEIEVKIRYGLSKNLTIDTSTTKTLIGSTTQTTSIRYRSIGQITPTSFSPGIYFDEWAANATSAPGPIPVNEQYDPPVGTQWQFYEWFDSGGGAMVALPLSLVGASTGGATTEPINIGATTIQGSSNPTAERFSGDPGVGKFLMGWDSTGTNFTTHNNFRATLRAASAGAAYPANPDIREGVYRIFAAANNGVLPDVFGSSGEGRAAAAAGIPVLSLSYDLTSSAQALDYITGGYDAWHNTLASRLVEIHELYGTKFWINMDNEPEQTNPGKPSLNPQWLARMRRRARYTYFYLLSRGVPRDIFEVTGPMTFNQVSYQHADRWEVPIQLTATSWPGGVRGDAMHYYHPDWKETITQSGGFWTAGGDGLDPNPSDFIRDGESDEYGTGPIVKMWNHNTYDKAYEAQGSINWTLTTFRNSKVSSPGKAGNYQTFFKSIYQNTTGLPIYIGEWGYGVWEDTFTGGVHTCDPAVTADVYVNDYLQDMVDNNYVGLSKWLHDPNSYLGSSGGGHFYFSWHTHGTNSTSFQPDPANANTKAFAAMWSHPAVINPPAP